MRSHHALALLALLLLLGAGYWALSSSPPSREALEASAAPSAATEQTPAPDSQALPETRSERADAAPAAVAPPVPAAATVPHSKASSWTLWLDVRGPAHAQPVEVTVRARPDGAPFAGPERVVASCALNQRTRIEVGDLLKAQRALAALVIEARHPVLRAEVLGITLPPVEAAGAPPASVEATLNMNAATRVLGEAHHSSGGPRTSTVGVWRFEDGALQPEVLLQSNTDAAGRFDIELPGTGEYLVVATHKDYQPSGKRFHVLPAEVHDAGALVLETGAMLRGRFTIGGRTPARAVSFTLRRLAEGQQLHWNWMGMGPAPGTLIWTGARLERHSADTIADAEGGFVVQGLVPGDYTLHLHGFDEGHGRMNRDPRPVSVPDDNLVMELGWSRLAVRLQLADPSAPPEAAVLVLERPGREPERSDCFGGELTGQAEREFVFDAGEPLAFQLEVDGQEPVRRELFAPPAGTREELLLPVAVLDRSAKLRVELRGALPAEGTPFVVHVLPDDGMTPAMLSALPARGAHKARLSEGALRIEGLAPGPVELLIYAGEHAGQRRTHLLDARARVHLAPEQETLAIMSLELGGRLRVGQRDGRGGWSGVGCEIRGADGQRIDTIFVAYAPNGGGGASSSTSLPSLAPSEVVPNLAPGSYLVRVGGQDRTVAVRPGATTEVLLD